MTNTIYFNLDDASYSTSSPDSIISQQQDREGSGAAVGEEASSSVVVDAGAINAWIRPSSSVNREQVGNQIKISHQILRLLFHPVKVKYLIPPTSNLKNFSFKVLKTATNNFSPDYLLGRGGFGKVFKGWIDEYKLTATKPGRGTAVAVKRLGQGRSQGHEEWLAEINYLGSLYHPNLVKLLGYCLDHKERLLVYEFMPQGSLDKLLRNDAGSSYRPLSWALRMKITLGVAKALAFLHSAETNVIHRGCQTSNILLDSDYNAKLSDFGLAMEGPSGDMSHVYTSVRGTSGFIAPEYLCKGHLTAKSDVYHFGVVLLEILSGQRPFDIIRNYETSLVEWATLYLKNKHENFHIVDSQLEGQYSLGTAQTVARLAVECMSTEAKFRPNMDTVVTALEQLQDAVE